ncbi:unnamed protein product [Phyllotreta striolata]|uniref:Farnesol dehydrogenase-like n=1 Tax=Phyllotreta striolata TaxID=444603 RepID=A0A9N9XWD5_PHYSR|nr:unnamed protein product [Phyllotreta striolata]
MPLSMKRWVGKTAIVTGASVGIGAAIAERLVIEGLQVVGIARRVHLIQDLSRRLANEKGKLHALRCDVTIEDNILKVFEWCREHLGPVHILINNAGIVENTNLIDGDTRKWRNVIDTNVFGLCVGTREAVREMVRHRVDGHIVHMNSVGGHRVPYFTFSNVYPGTKHAVTALATTLKKELSANKLDIKITSISPGIVKTEIGKSCYNFEKQVSVSPSLTVEDVVDAVIYALSTGPNVLVEEIILQPLHEPF